MSEAKAELGNDITAIERVINHQHIDDLLPGTDKVGAENLYYLGQAIAQMWESRLLLIGNIIIFRDFSYILTISSVQKKYRVGIAAWFKNLGIRVTLLEESKSFKSLCVKALRFWNSNQSVTLV